jgi:RNA polymerase sigma-54 factor
VQSGFFDHGLTALRPLTLKAVADAVGVHESTVSRVTANKYLASPRGFFELKFFFSVAIASAGGGEAHSAQAVRDRIRALIAAEPPGKPLSDDVLVKQLQADGIDVARRTVAKYREALHIPSSVERRRRAEAAV